MNKKLLSLIAFIALAFSAFGLFPADRAFAEPSPADDTTVMTEEATLTEEEKDAQKINDYIQNGVNLVTALAGLAITAAFIVGGIQYSTSGGNPTASAAAKKRIGNAVMALLALVFLYTFLQWLVPGGIFSN